MTLAIRLPGIFRRIRPCTSLPVDPLRRRVRSVPRENYWQTADTVSARGSR